MTLQALPTQPTVYIPDAGFHLAKVARLDSEAAAVKVENDAIDAFWEHWWADCDELMLKQKPLPPPAERLAIAQNKPIVVPPPLPQLMDDKGQPMGPPPPAPPASWHEQRARFPNDFKAQMADWVQLEPVSVRRDQVMRELAKLDMLETGQQGMTNPPPLPGPGPAFSPAAAPPPLQWPK